MATEFLNYPGCEAPGDTPEAFFGVVSAVSDLRKWQAWPSVGTCDPNDYPSGPPAGVAIELRQPEPPSETTILEVTTPRLPSYPLPQTVATEFSKTGELDGLVGFHEFCVSASLRAKSVDVSVTTVVKGQLAEGDSDSPVFHGTYVNDKVLLSRDGGTWTRVFRNIKHGKDGIAVDPPGSSGWYTARGNVVNDLWSPAARRLVARVVLLGMHYGRHPTTTVITGGNGGNST